MGEYRLARLTPCMHEQDIISYVNLCSSFRLQQYPLLLYGDLHKQGGAPSGRKHYRILTLMCTPHPHRLPEIIPTK